MGKVKINKWFKGVLEQIEYEFKTIKEALSFARKDVKPEADVDQTVKVYNEAGELVESTKTNTNTDTYA
jgi:hypothetical protein